MNSYLSNLDAQGKKRTQSEKNVYSAYIQNK